jgi:nucleoside-diphosphate-sugar epimerase
VNILISGINGYLGRLIYRALSIRYPSSFFYALSSKKSSSDVIRYFNSVTDIPIDMNFDYVFYLNWLGVNGKDKFNEEIQYQNYLNGINFFKLVKNNSKKLIYFGTIGEYLAIKYGKQDDLIYAFYKNKLHNSILAELPKESNFLWLQLANVFGRDNLTSNILGLLLKSYQSKIEFNFNTKCNTLYDFIYDNDLIRILLRLIEFDKLPNTIYIGPGSPKPLKDFVNLVNNHFNLSIGTSINKDLDDKYFYDYEAFDNSKLLNLLNYDFQFTNFLEALNLVTQEVDNRESIK